MPESWGEGQNLGDLGDQLRAVPGKPYVVQSLDLSNVRRKRNRNVNTFGGRYGDPERE